MPHTMFEYAKSTHEGTEVEKMFKAAFLARYPNYDVKFTSSNVNKCKHIDVVCENDENQWTFDVKKQKLIHRRDKNASEDFTWVELQNNFGGPGWCKGEEQFIAFELNDEFIIVEREKLLALVEEKKLPGLFTKNKNLAPYSQYRRVKDTNLDIIVLTPISDILEIMSGKIHKA